MAERRTRLDQPFARSRGPRLSLDPEAFGQWTERVARFIGTGRFLVYMTVVVAGWIFINTVPGLPHADPFPFIFLTLLLSLQASYAAPLILLAQNRQSDRDRVSMDEDRDEARRSKADLEYLARELAAVRLALGEVVTRDFLRSELARSEEEPRKKKKDKHDDSAGD